VEAADRALYRAKQNGRDRLEYSPLPMDFENGEVRL
jgi:hypothetical protein